MTTEIKPGCYVKRDLCGSLMTLKITRIEDGVIHCGPWKFDLATGAEIDEEIGWGPPPLKTGSRLLNEPISVAD